MAQRTNRKTAGGEKINNRNIGVKVLLEMSRKQPIVGVDGIGYFHPDKNRLSKEYLKTHKVTQIRISFFESMIGKTYFVFTQPNKPFGLAVELQEETIITVCLLTGWSFIEVRSDEKGIQLVLPTGKDYWKLSEYPTGNMPDMFVQPGGEFTAVQFLGVDKKPTNWRIGRKDFPGNILDQILEKSIASLKTKQ